jgi:4-hydroxybutyrate CoA-transferase
MGRVSDAATAASRVQSGDALFVDTSAPDVITAAIAERDDLEDVEAYAYGYPYRDRSALAALGTADGVDLSVSMIPPALRDLVADGTVDYVPRPLHAATRDPFFGAADRRRVAILQTTDEGDARTRRIGCTSAFASDAGEPTLAGADAVLVETNPDLPPATPPRYVRRNDVAVEVSVDRTPPRLGAVSVGETERTIAERIADQLPAHPTVQLGVGAVGTAVGEVLADRGPLDVWSGLLGVAVRHLIEGDAVGSVTGSVAIGRQAEFYRWLRERDEVRFEPPSRIHDQVHLRAQPALVAINSALQVDLTGAANAESIGGRPLGGIGGQLDFMRAASADPDGLAIVALPSRTAGGTGKIVPSFDPRDPVTTPCSAVDLVVTEHGVADLRGLAATERAEAVIGVAHPDDRADLRASAGR